MSIDFNNFLVCWSYRCVWLQWSREWFSAPQQQHSMWGQFALLCCFKLSCRNCPTLSFSHAGCLNIYSIGVEGIVCSETWCHHMEAHLQEIFLWDKVGQNPFQMTLSLLSSHVQARFWLYNPIATAHYNRLAWSPVSLTLPFWDVELFPIAWGLLIFIWFGKIKPGLSYVGNRVVIVSEWRNYTAS